MKSQSYSDSIIFTGIIVLLIFAPLAFGSVHVWAYSLVEVRVFHLLLLWFVDRLIVSKEDIFTWVKTPVNLWLLVLLVVNTLNSNPSRAMSWYQLGYVYSQYRYDRMEYLNKWLPLAKECFEQALKCAPMDKYQVFNIVRYWMWRSQLLPKNLKAAPGNSRPERWEEGVAKFQELFQHYLTINPDGWKDAFDSVWDTYPEDQIVFGIVPDENEEMKSLVLQEIAKRSGM